MGVMGLLVFLTNCGFIPALDHQEKGPEFRRQFSVSNSVFLPFINEFEENARKELGQKDFKVVNVPINFGDTENKEFVGVCFKYSNGEKEILIKKEWWDGFGGDSKNSLAQKRSLIFHELGHCVLNRKHTNDLVDKDDHKIKVSLMHSSIIPGREFLEFHDEYIHELFTQDQSKLLEKIK